MSIRKFKDVTYDLSTTDGFLCNTITPVTATTGESVSAIEVFNDIIVNSADPARPLTSDNMNATIDDVSEGFVEVNNQLNSKVPKSTTVNGKALSSSIILMPGDIGAEPAFSKNAAFNKNFGTLSGTVCEGNDSRLSNSRRCDNTFDDATVAKANLGLHSVATSGNYNELANKPYILSKYDVFPGILMSAVAGFSNLGRVSSSDSTITKSLNYKKKYCFVGYGGYTAGMISSISGGNWQGSSLSYISDCVIVPTYTGSMAGYQKTFQFITGDGIYRYVMNSGVNDISIRISRPDCYAYSEATMYTYY